MVKDKLAAGGGKSASWWVRERGAWTRTGGVM